MVHIFSARWNPAPVTNLGMTRRPTRHSSNPTRASAFIITFTSLLRIWASVIYGYLPGHPFDCNFTAMGTTCSASQLRRRGISFTLLDNALSEIEHWKKPRIWPTPFSPEHLHRHLDRLTRELCPVIRHFLVHHGSLMHGICHGHRLSIVRRIWRPSMRNWCALESTRSNPNRWPPSSTSSQ